MASAIEAPATMQAEGPTSHTQNQAGRLTAPQLRLLHRPVDPKRIGKDDKGFAHMEAWDIKRYMIRVFGFAGYDTENRELTLVREIEIPAGNKSRWTVVYRAQVRLIVKDVQGRELAHWDGEAAGGASNQPKLDDAHDMAMKTASSQALKRAATHLGDAFGLSLYNGGSVAPVVNFSAAHPPEQWEKVPAPLPEPDDDPVRPEPGSQPSTQDSAPEAQQQSDPEDQENVLEAFQKRVSNGWNHLGATEMALAEAKEKGINPVVPFDGDHLQIQDVLELRIKALKEKAAQGGDTERSAA